MSRCSREERTAFSGGINGLFWEKVPWFLEASSGFALTLLLKSNGKVTTMGNRFYDFPRFLTDIDALLVSNHGSPR